MTRHVALVLLTALACAADPVDDGRRPPPPECLALDSTFDRYECLVPYFQALTELEGARFAVCRAATLQGDGTVDDCHALAHVIGAAAYEHSGNAGEALASCGSACVEGCLHGVMEVFVGALDPDIATVTAAVAPLCDEVPDDEWYPCVHGIGHGLRFHGLFSLRDALTICETARDEAWGHVCAGGVFMEHVEIELAVGQGDPALVLAGICADLEGDPRRADCHVAIGEGLMLANGHDLDAALEACLHLADADAIDLCRHGAEAEGDLASSPDDRGC